MFFCEWALWNVKLQTEEEKRRQQEVNIEHGIKKHFIYEVEYERGRAFAKLPASSSPKSRGPVYVMTEDILELRSGFWESKRGYITLGTLPVILVICGFAYILTTAVSHLFHLLAANKTYTVTLITAIFFLLMIVLFAWVYAKYLFRIARLESFTSRHQLIRFNRITQQVYLHRPKYCGGLAVLPWEGIDSSASDPSLTEDQGVGVPLLLSWSPTVTGLLHLESAFVGRAGNNQSELRHEWEFIRRFMDEGPEGLPRPHISSHFPWPWQAFRAQFEGTWHYLMNANPITKVGLVLISPAFIMVGIAHWISLLLCWKPRWPKIIRQAGLPGKPVPPQTSFADYPAHVQERLIANQHLWAPLPGERPAKKRRSSKSQVQAEKADSGQNT